MNFPKKTLLIICDGLGDRPCKELNFKTPLEAAKKPNLNALAKKGACGLMYTLGPGIRAGSDTAHLSIFGYNIKKYYLGRGPLEALGLKMQLKQGDVAFRANVATVNKKGIIVDRRAGRIKDSSELANALDGIEIRGVQFIVKAGTAHRLALVMRGKGLSANISDSDPHKEGVEPLIVKPCDDSKEAKFTAGILNEFLKKAHNILEKHPLNKERKRQGLPVANIVLVRGAGMFKRIPSFEERYNMKACCIAGAGLYKGVARFVGMDVLDVEGATGRADTNVKAKIKKAIEALNAYDFVFVHIKACDVFGHDGDAKGKKSFIEKIDSALKPLLKLKDILIVITADHSTPCCMKDHSGDAVPVLIAGPSVRSDCIAKFEERECAKGYYRFNSGTELMNEILNLTAKAKMVGS